MGCAKRHLIESDEERSDAFALLRAGVGPESHWRYGMIMLEVL